MGQAFNAEAVPYNVATLIDAGRLRGIGSGEINRSEVAVLIDESMGDILRVEEPYNLLTLVNPECVGGAEGGSGHVERRRVPRSDQEAVIANAIGVERSGQASGVVDR